MNEPTNQSTHGGAEREEQILNAALDAGKQPLPTGEIWNSPLGRRVMSAYEIGFLDGAEWADEHPDLYTVTRKAIAREREYLIKKATEWLTAHVTEEKYHPERGFWNIGRFLDDFKKYMEKQ